MVASVIKRLAKLVLTSVACSLPVLALQMIDIAHLAILLISSIAFFVIIAINMYRSSAYHKRRKHIIKKKILPLCIYLALGIVAYFLLPPRFFNMVFLPLRFGEAFYLRTLPSVLLVSVLLLIIACVVSYFGLKSKKRK